MAIGAERKRGGGMCARPMARRMLFAIVLVVLGGVVGGVPLPKPANVGPVVPEPHTNVPGYGKPPSLSLPLIRATELTISFDPFIGNAGGDDNPRDGFIPSPHHHHRRDLDGGTPISYNPPSDNGDGGSVSASESVRLEPDVDWYAHWHRDHPPGSAQLSRRNAAEDNYVAWYEHWRQRHPVKLAYPLVRRASADAVGESKPLSASKPSPDNGHRPPPVHRLEARTAHDQAGEERELEREEEQEEEEEEREEERREMEREGEDDGDNYPRRRHPGHELVKRDYGSEDELRREEEKDEKEAVEEMKREAEKAAESNDDPPVAKHPFYENPGTGPVKRGLEKEEKIPDWFTYIGPPDTGSGSGAQPNRGTNRESSKEAKAKSVKVARNAPAADWKLFLSAQF